MNVTGVTTEHVELPQHPKMMFWLSSYSALTQLRRQNYHIPTALASCVTFDLRACAITLTVVISSKETREALLNWSKHDDESERFCVVDGNIQSQMTDLTNKQ